MNGEKDQICNYASTSTFLKGIGNAEMIKLENVGHGFSKEENWVPQFHLAFQKILTAGATEKTSTLIKSNLPLHFFETKTHSNSLVFMLSGDGGWTSFDEGIANSLVNRGTRVIGLDSQKYFWKAKTPNQVASDINQVLSECLKTNPNLIISMLGYSFGADVTPFIVNRLPEDIKKSLKSVVLISPDEFGDFEIHVSDMLNFGSKTRPYHVIEELRKLNGIKKLCVFGSDEDHSITSKFRETNSKIEILPGGHHFNNDFQSISDRIIKM